MRPYAEKHLWVALGKALGADTTWASLPTFGPEHGEWRTIPGHPAYEIAEDGTIRRAVAGRYKRGAYGPGRLLRHTVGKHGYPIVNLRDPDGRQRTHLVHRLVALAFLGPPPFEGAWVAHRDDEKTNPHRRNLRWATPAENHADAVANGLVKIGEDHMHAKLSNASVAEIRELHSTGEATQVELARRYGVSKSLVSQIVLGRVRRCG